MRPITKNSSLGRMLMRFAIRFDIAKNAAIAPMSQMSSSEKPCARTADALIGNEYYPAA